MFEIIKTKRKLRAASLKYELIELETATKMLTEARNSIIRDEDENDWNLLGQAGRGIVEEADHNTILRGVFKLYHDNTHARAIVRSLVKFTLGKGPKIDPDAENEKVNEVWEDFRRQNKFNWREKEIATRLFRDGEVFLRLFREKSPNQNGDVKIRFIRATQISKPTRGVGGGKKFGNEYSFGIKTEPEDVETPVSYTRCDSDGNFKEEIKAEEIIHLKVFSDSDQKRGVSVLRVCSKRLKQYDEWLEDRIVLNKVRSAIALVRTVEGSASKVKEIRNENLSDNLSSSKKKVKAPPRGTIITASKGIEYNMLSPNINASDVAEDGRSMLLSIAAGVGMPEMIFTGDYSNANYASSLIAQNPFVREIEEWQDYFTGFYEDLFEIVIQNKIDHGDLPKETETTCRVEFPPMIAADIDKLAKAFEILFKYKIVSKKTWRGKMGLDDEIEKGNLDGEEGDEVYPPGTPGGQSPFNLPMSPINQFGAELIKAVKEANWEEANSLADKILDVAIEGDK